MRNIIADTLLTKPLVFIGPGRSGSTVISEIVFRHQALAWPSNYLSAVPWLPQINLLRSLFENRFWRIHGQKSQLNDVSFFNALIFKPGEAYPFWRYLTQPAIDFSRGFLIHDRACDKDARRIRRAFSRMVSYQGRSRLALKITGPSRIGYLRSIFPDAMFCNIVREPLATISSMLRAPFWKTRGMNQLWWTGAYSTAEIEWAVARADRPALLAALQYTRVMEITAEEVRAHAVPCHTVRYEDFVSAPLRAVSGILEFAGLPQSQQVEDYMKSIRIFDRNTTDSEQGMQSLSESDREGISKVLAGSLP